MTPATTSTCPTCHGAVFAGDRFCGGCGTAIGSTGLTSTPPQAPTSRNPSSSDPTAAGFASDPSPWAAIGERLQQATLGEFEIFTELGRGGMAAVYLARDLALNRRVAIKVMAPGLLLGPGMIERFRQEAVTVANLQHAHIISIYGVRQLADLHFFVMQFVPGRTLEGVVRDIGALPIAVVRAWLYQIGTALGYAHRRGVIHRDIKPGNILLNVDGEAIVTDFGIAKVAETPGQTQTGTVVGTPVYMSPEQCYAKELTGASDQYSLGVVAYEMLVGRPPFSGSSFTLMRSHTDTPPPALREIRPEIPPAMEAAVMRMLAKTPEERFPSLAEALVSLGATPLAPDDPLHATLQHLAAVEERMGQLADVIRTPASPVPQTRERPRPASLVAGTPAAQPNTTPPSTPGPTQPAVAATAPSVAPSSPTAPASFQAAARPAPATRLLRWAIPLGVAVGTIAFLTLRPGRGQSPREAHPAAASNSRPVAPPNVNPPAVAERPRQDSASTDSAASPTTPTTAAANPVTRSAPIESASEPAPNVASAAVRTARRVDIRPAKPAAISPGRSLTLEATVIDAAGEIMNGTAVTWATSNARVATVDPARGIVHGVGAGAVRITARAATALAGVMVTVLPSSDSSAVSASTSHTRLAGPDVPSATPPNGGSAPPSTASSAPKTEAQLRAEIQTVLATYAHAIELRDTSLIRRVFPNAGYELLTRWQTTFDDARGPITMNDTGIEIVDTPQDVPGSQVHVRAKYAARFSSRAARSDQTFPVAFTAVLQREGGAWRITSIR
jgi:serine/threonine-protein kinase